MKQVKPYLIFPGNCREALLFYEECFGGEIVLMQTFADSRIEVPEDYKEKIFNSEFTADKISFMASNNLPNAETKIGNNFALFVSFQDAEGQKRSFNKLSEGGKVLFPIQNNFGMLVDKFGIQWMLESKP